MRGALKRLLARMRSLSGIEGLSSQIAGLGREVAELGVAELRREVAELGISELRHQVVELRALLERTMATVESVHRAQEATAREFQHLAHRSSHAPDGAGSKVAQLVLANQYCQMARNGSGLPRFQDVEFRAFSQNGEDGILLYIFSLIGMGERRCIEVCAGDGIQCNTANLIINHGWQGLLFDGDPQLVERGRSFYATLGDTFCLPPTFVNSWISRENLNQLIAERGFAGPIDLLSLDIDGVDYWVWEALDVVQPRVVVAEIQCIWGDQRAVTVPYAADFRAQSVDGFGIYSGASLPAFVKLARRKGYRLVGVQRLGFNAFFVQDGICGDLLPEVDVTDCVDRPFVHWARSSLLPKVKDLAWVDV